VKQELALALGWPSDPEVRAQIEAAAGKPIPVYGGEVGGFSCLTCGAEIELGPSLAAVVNAGEAVPICGLCAGMAGSLGANWEVRDLGNTPINET
jgi:hypothetical protein